MKDYKMRKAKRESSAEFAKELLLSGEYGVLSTVGEDGFPYGVPVNYVYDGKMIYFHCAKDAGHKQDNLKFCNNISFTVVQNNEVNKERFSEKFESAIVFGIANKATDKKRYALELLIKKYSPEFIESGMEHIDKSFDITDIFEIEILKISGKIHL